MISIAATACSGVLISPIHILTAAHCLFYTRAPALPKEECRQIGFSNSRQARSDTFSVFVGSRCIDPNKCRIPWMTPAHVYYHEYYNECSSENDIAIFELADYVPRHWATPICLPERNQTIAHYLNVAGSGWRGMPSLGRPDLEPIGQQVVRVIFSRVADFFIEVKTEPTKGVCPGDSGGPLFQENDKKQNVVVGITSLQNSCSLHSPDLPGFFIEGKAEDYFTDVRRHLDWICGITGVCRDQ